MTDPIPASLTTALAFAEFGFGVFSVWGIKDGHCLCPKGAKCDQKPGKHPIPVNGFKAHTTDPTRIRTMLAAAGSAGNYGVFPAENTIIIDADGDDWQGKLRTLGLPKTLAVLTANGSHLYFYWPAEYGPAPTHLFGWKVRSLAHEGYVVGPGSTHQSGVRYRFAHQNGFSDEEMVARVKPFPKALVPPEKQKTLGLAPIQNATITVGGSVEPETIQEGGRYDYLRDRARPLWGIGLSGEALFNAVNAFNQRFPVPHDRATVERAIDEERLNRNFQRDPNTYVPPVVIPSTGLFINVLDYIKQNSAVPEYVSPLAAYGTVTLISGPPKGGKSTLISNLLGARQVGSVFLWGDPVPQGPMALVTEEGGYPVVRKTQGLTSLDILDRMAFAVAGLKSLDHLLAALDGWLTESPALVVIDTLAVWGDIKDENDATAATNAITALRVWAQSTGSAVVLVHHTRKGGGDHGEGIRGSGGIFAAVDQSVELAFTNDRQSDDRGLDIVGRLSFGETKTLAFDRTTMTYSVTTRVTVEKYPTDQFPLDGSGVGGWTTTEAGTAWGMTPNAAGRHLKEHCDNGVLVARLEQAPGSRAKHLVYHRARPLLDLDTRSTGERMADIFKAD